MNDKPVDGRIERWLHQNLILEAKAWSLWVRQQERIRLIKERFGEKFCAELEISGKENAAMPPPGVALETMRDGLMRSGKFSKEGVPKDDVDGYFSRVQEGIKEEVRLEALLRGSTNSRGR